MKIEGMWSYSTKSGRRLSFEACGTDEEIAVLATALGERAEIVRPTCPVPEGFSEPIVYGDEPWTPGRKWI